MIVWEVHLPVFWEDTDEYETGTIGFTYRSPPAGVEDLAQLAQQLAQEDRGG